MKVLAPDYYDSFRCKEGACRHTCCQGWGITISQREYYRLLGLACEKKLRSRLDCALRCLDDADPQRFAAISPNWTGDCPIHDGDGLCMLQKTLGENALPCICRLYPRAIRADYEPECSCSASCEAVVELLQGREAPLGFREEETAQDARRTLPPDPDPLADCYHDIRKLVISLLQARFLPMSARLVSLGGLMEGLQISQRQRDGGGMRRLAAQSAPFAPCAAPSGDPVFPRLWALCALLCADSESLAPYWQPVAQGLCLPCGADVPRPFPAEALARWQAAVSAFDRDNPSWPVLCEHLLVNHVFFDCFPFSARRESMWDEFLSLCAVHALLRLLTVLWAAEHPGREAQADVVAAVFRMAEHSDFDLTSPAALKKLDLASPAALYAFLTDLA